MAEPIVFISRNRIREGQADEFRSHYTQTLPAAEREKPGTVVQLAYGNEELEVTVVRVFPDAEAFDQQLQGADERSKRTYELIEPLSVEVFGAPKASTLERMRRIAGSGVPVRISGLYLGGFIR